VLLAFSHACRFLVTCSSVSYDFSFLPLLPFCLLPETLTIWTYYQYREVRDCRVGVTGWVMNCQSVEPKFLCLISDAFNMRCVTEVLFSDRVSILLTSTKVFHNIVVEAAEFWLRREMRRERTLLPVNRVVWPKDTFLKYFLNEEKYDHHQVTVSETAS
jgi:hypothetical protein